MVFIEVQECMVRGGTGTRNFGYPTSGPGRVPGPGPDPTLLGPGRVQNHFLQNKILKLTKIAKTLLNLFEFYLNRQRKTDRI